MAKKKSNSKLIAGRTYRRFAGLAPKKMLKGLERKLIYAGIEEDPQIWGGQVILLALCIGLVLLLAYLVIYNPIATWTTGLIAFGLLFGGAAFVLILYYLSLYFKIANRTSAVEKILPDFLLLVLSNLRAGMSPFTAFVQAARPEFKYLYDEVRKSAGRAGGSTSLPDVLNDVGSKFDSQIFKRTIALFAKGIKSGGQLSRLLKSSADEIRHIQDLRAELVTATRTYTIFLGFIIIVIMPFLLGVSTHFITIFTQIQNEAGAGSAEMLVGGAPSLSGKISITANEMMMTSLAALISTSLLVSGLMGIIGRGSALYGVKYFPILSIASILMFFLAKTVVASLLSGFTGS
jgi:Flp pilus assembly protein TadB